ncbi:MAG TPA: F0F1 ATP synthase subunit B [Vicinamibacterales bacterium]|nr:F0F1 ATP synthase subunit B [Vicinamibacterales bacterium]
MLNPLVQPDPGLFIWTILTFLALLALLTKFAWGPLLSALEGRHERIRGSLDEAKRATEEGERLRREAEEIVREARVEAHTIVASGRSDGERVREEIKQKARQEASTILAAAERRIELESARAREDVRNEAVDLSVLIASKLLRRNISVEDNRRLIDEVVSSFGRRAN